MLTDFSFLSDKYNNLCSIRHNNLFSPSNTFQVMGFSFSRAVKDFLCSPEIYLFEAGIIFTP